jgi:hypothetical protein
VKEDEMGRAYSTHDEKRCAWGVMVVKPEGNNPLGRPRSRRVKNIKMDLREL